jgi:glycosyltransferase involved in cell wall biosynthesis
MDRLRDIFELLDSIKAQAYPNIETIFVAERSEELYERVKTYAEEKAIPNVKMVFNDGDPGASAARNLGIKKAGGEIIAFVDDDALLFPDWAQEMVQTYQDDSIIGVAGSALPLWEAESMSWFPEEFYWVASCTAFTGWDKLRDTRNAWTTNSSFRREAFDLGEFFLTETGPGKGRQWRGFAEDEELTFRIRRRTGRRVVYNPRVKVWHKVYKHRLTLRFIANNAYWIGLTRPTLKRLYPKDDASGSALDMERQLLKRIFTRLFPDILKNFFSHPVIAWRKVEVTITALSFVALGYFVGFLSSPFNRHKAIIGGSA